MLTFEFSFQLSDLLIKVLDYLFRMLELILKTQSLIELSTEFLNFCLFLLKISVGLFKFRGKHFESCFQLRFLIKKSFFLISFFLKFTSSSFGALDFIFFLITDLSESLNLQSELNDLILQCINLCILSSQFLQFFILFSILSLPLFNLSLFIIQSLLQPKYLLI